VAGQLVKDAKTVGKHGVVVRPATAQIIDRLRRRRDSAFQDPDSAQPLVIGAFVGLADP
jgi:hypothetical protein